MLSGSLQTMLYASKTSLSSSLSRDPNRVLDIHSSLSYDIISTKGSLMSDGNRVPGNADGMAAFSVDSNHTVIVRNHELGRTSEKLMGAFKILRKMPYRLEKIIMIQQLLVVPQIFSSTTILMKS